jgi:hypothetical protein
MALLVKMGLDPKPYYPYGLQGVLTSGVIILRSKVASKKAVP